MSDVQRTFPRRDAEGRIVGLTDLLGMVLVGVVVGVVALLLFDGIFAAIGAGEFGQANGWLALILPAWVFVEEFRAWGPAPTRIVAALVAAGIGVTTGLLAAGVTADLPPLASGALAATVSGVAYALVWFLGVRWLARRTG